jgi:hypothetical protein
MNIIIDPEFRDLIPPLAPQELEQLHSSIRDEGCRDPLVVWHEENTLVDGHNRYAFCTEHGIEMNFIERCFTSRQSVKNFIILNQLGRRNVDPDTASMLRGMLYNGAKKDQGGDHKSKDQSDTLINAAETIAQQTGVSAPTVKRDGKFAEALEKLGMTIAEFKASGKSKKAIIAEAFPPKEKPKASPLPAPVDPDESEAAEEDELEPLVVDESRSEMQGTAEPGVALVYARTALDALNKIPKRDPSRNQAISMIDEWVKRNTKKKSR